MKKFNLFDAKKQLTKVVTREGKRVEIFTFSRDVERFPIVAIIDNKKVCEYTNEGKFYDDGRNSKLDLFIKQA